MFKDSFIAWINESTIRLENENGHITWQWNLFNRFFESPFFFHLYFNEKSFFLLPKDDMTEDLKHELRALLNEKLENKK